MSEYDGSLLREDVALAKQSKEDAARRAKQIQEDYLAVFLDSGPGWRVLQDILGRTAVLGAAFSGNSRDIYNQGRRSIGMHVLDMLGMNTPAGMMLAAVRGAAHDSDMRAALARELRIVGAKQKEGKENG